MSGLRKVMCVEDDPDIRLILDLCLSKIGGYEVMCCEGGQLALDVVSSFRPDLVLLDVMMPGLSGPETLTALRLLPVMKSVPIVFMTAKAMIEEVTELLECGATGVIVKPFNSVTLSNDIKLYWEHGRASC
jgi:CheY-like chemotaxis protein